MNLERLHVKNWKSFTDKEFLFKHGVNLIEGDNYSGKTSFVQALYFALFNETLYPDYLTAKELRKEGEKEAMVELDFSINLDRYRIRRIIKGEKNVKVDSFLLPIDSSNNEGPEIEVTSKKGEDLKKIEEFLDSPKDYAKIMHFIQEESIYQFLNDPKYTINTDLNAILKLDYLGTINGFCDDAIKALEKDTSTLEKKGTAYEKYLEEKKPEFESLETKSKVNTESLKQITDSIALIEKKNKDYTDLANLESEKEDLEIQIKVGKENIDNLSQTLEETQTKLDDISRKETERAELKKRVDIFENNENQLKQLRKNKEELQEKLIKAETELALFKERQTELKEFQKKEQALSNNLKSVAMIEKKFKIVEKKLQDYNGAQAQIDETSKKIGENLKILAKFKKGECPISHDNCPVAGNLMTDRQKEISTLTAQKKSLEDSIKAKSNPKKDYDDLKGQIEGFEVDKNELTQVSKKISELEPKVQGLVEVNKSKDALTTEKKDSEGKIKRIQEANEKLKNDYDQYIRLEERVKDKDTLLERIEELTAKVNKAKEDFTVVETDYAAKLKKIEEFKMSKKFEALSEIAKETAKKLALEKELQDLKTDTKVVEKGLDQLKKKSSELLSPYSTQADLQKEIETTVHKTYKMIFFRDALNATITEIQESSLKEIKENCNKMWAKFKSSAGMDSINWDDNFLPSVGIGGHDRSVYQLSASEKVLVYFSIRAALLAKLGPNYFIVADNLLGPFMKENQKVVLALLREVIDIYNIHQVIFTGFDVDATFKCENKIKL